VKNCVAIGLSSGFVEPLESTGIFFIQHGIEQLLNRFPGHRHNEENVKAYNRAIANCIDGVREFLTLHYVAGTRQDTPFWKATKHDLVLPNGLADRLDLWKHELPTKRTIFQEEHGFTDYSYSVMLLGLGHRPQYSLAALDYVSPTHALLAFDKIRRKAEHLTRTLPSTYEYLCFKRAQTTLFAMA
jgi:tryptophan halogenase